MTLEVATSETAIDAEQWIDPEVVALAGISQEELARMKAPPAYKRPEAPVPQPAYDESRYHLGYPPEAYRKMLSIPDEKMIERMSYPEPPMPV